MASSISQKETITLNATKWKTPTDFYKSYCASTSAAKWFGNNLDAFRDSLTGGVCLLTPKKIIIRNLSKKIKQNFILGEKFFRQIEEICAEMSVVLEIYPE